MNSAKRLTLTYKDHAPYAHALEELSWLTFVEMVEEAARYRDAFEWSDANDPVSDDDDAEETDTNEEEPTN
jgi:hypothetical protein